MNILSSKNIKIKEFLILQKKKSLQDIQSIFIVEGKKEIQMALKKYRPHELFYCIKNNNLLSFIENKFPIVIELYSNVFHKLVYRKNNVWIIATFHRHFLDKKNLFIPKNPILLILAGLEKPGNLGAIIRSAEAIGIDSIVLSEVKTDIFNTNVCRTSLGSIFIHNIIIYNSNELFKWLKRKRIKILATYFSSKTTNIYNFKFKSGTAIIVGNESLGLDIHWINNSDKLLKIPMYGNINSLNVSNAVAIILFEVLRHRIYL